MTGRGLLFVAVLTVAIAAPYLLSEGKNRDRLANWWKSFRAKSAEGDRGDDFDMASFGATPYSTQRAGSPYPPSAAVPGGSRPSTERPSTIPLEQLLRFDVTPSWVVENWPRVTTRLVDGQLEGLRVTLVTGTEAHDLVGSLTYYFDKRLQLQRILFHGHTGDPRRLVGLVTQHYGLEPDPSVGGWLFTAKWNGKPSSLLHVQHVPVVKENNRRHRVQVELELNRPGAPYGMSSTSEELLTTRQDKSSPSRQRRLAS
jgi:hypothetical protein